jgi:hypothetical protein
MTSKNIQMKEQNLVAVVTVLLWTELFFGGGEGGLLHRVGDAPSNWLNKAVNDFQMRQQ